MLLGVHTLVREFCRSKIEEKEWNEYLKDASSFYMNHSGNIPEEYKSLPMVLEEVDAAELLMEACEYEEATDIIAGVTELLDRWGLGRFRESLYIRILPHVEGLAKAGLLHNLGILYQDRGEYEKALVQYQKSLKIKEELGNRAGVSISLHQIGMIHQYRGDYEEALVQYQKSLKIKEELGDRAGVAISLHQIGMIYQERGEYKEALVQYQKSLKIEEELGNRVGVALSLHQIGMIHQVRGEYEEALVQYQKSLKIKEELGDRSGVASSLHQIARIHQERGEFSEAFKLFVSALKILAELGSPDEKIALNNLIKLRQQWGADLFDAAWLEQIGTELPEIFKNESIK
ncbi:MAG: tetratricopeptide repeat protein [bacterium]